MGMQWTTHMRNNLKPNRPVCDQPDMTDQSLSSNIDAVDCVTCLRLLVKDAVIYGVDRRVKKR